MTRCGFLKYSISRSLGTISGAPGVSTDMLVSLSMNYNLDASSNEEMVQKLKASKLISDPRVCSTMLAVDRGIFAPESNSPYKSKPIPVEFEGVRTSVTTPLMHAIALELLAPSISQVKGDCVDLGCGTGYLTACMRHLKSAKENSADVRAGKVSGIEYYPNLVDFARSRISRALIAEAEEISSGTEVSTEYLWISSSLSAIHVGFCPGTPEPPKEWVEALAPGGKMIIPLGTTESEQDLMLFERNMDGKISSKNVMRCMYALDESLRVQREKVNLLEDQMQMGVLEERLRIWREEFEKNNPGKKPSLKEMMKDEEMWDILKQISQLKRKKSPPKFSLIPLKL